MVALGYFVVAKNLPSTINEVAKEVEEEEWVDCGRGPLAKASIQLGELVIHADEAGIALAHTEQLALSGFGRRSPTQIGGIDAPLRLSHPNQLDAFLQRLPAVRTQAYCERIGATASQSLRTIYVSKGTRVRTAPDESAPATPMLTDSVLEAVCIGDHWLVVRDPSGSVPGFVAVVDAEPVASCRRIGASLKGTVQYIQRSGSDALDSPVDGASIKTKLSPGARVAMECASETWAVSFAESAGAQFIPVADLISAAERASQLLADSAAARANGDAAAAAAFLAEAESLGQEAGLRDEVASERLALEALTLTMKRNQAANQLRAVRRARRAGKLDEAERALDGAAELATEDADLDAEIVKEREALANHRRRARLAHYRKHGVPNPEEFMPAGDWYYKAKKGEFRKRRSLSGDASVLIGSASGRFGTSGVQVQVSPYGVTEYSRVAAGTGVELNQRIGGDPVGKHVLLQFPLKPGQSWMRDETLKARIAEVGTDYEGPAGYFNDCIEIMLRYVRGPYRRSGTVFHETWCRGVGEVENSFMVLTRYEPIRRAR